MTAATPRDRAYLDLLRSGLANVRNFAHAGRAELCAAEADHLHNVPSLIGEANEHRRLYYLRAERAAYLARVRELATPDEVEWVGIWYAGPWAVLAACAGVDLADVG